MYTFLRTDKKQPRYTQNNTRNIYICLRLHYKAYIYKNKIQIE